MVHLTKKINIKTNIKMKTGVEMKLKLGLLGVVIALLISGCGKKPTYNKLDTTPYEIKECLKQLSTGSEIVIDEKIDKIVVHKEKRILTTYRNGKIVDTFRMSLGKNGDKGHKTEAGDYKTPTGHYRIVRKKCDRRLYRSLMISYPDSEDRARSKKLGVEPGGYITIHAQPKWNADGRGDNYTLSRDWTEGCMAISNRAMNILWRAVKNGVKIDIYA